MTAIPLGPQYPHPVRLYDLPEPKLKLTPRMVGAITAVAMLYGGLGMVMNLAGIDITIPLLEEPPTIVITPWPPAPEVVVKPSASAPVPVQIPTTAPVTNPIFPVDTLPTLDQTPIDVGPATGPADAPVSTQPEGPVTTTPPSQPPPQPSTIRNPTWLNRPSASQLGRLYPARAAERGLSGAAMLECRVTGQGSVTACTVVDESPKGYGFGDAALSSARYFKMSPRTVDGQTVEGARVRIPMGFNLAG